MINKDFWERVCETISGRAGSAEAVRLFQMREPIEKILPPIKEKREKSRSIRPNRGKGPR